MGMLFLLWLLLPLLLNLNDIVGLNALKNYYSILGVPEDALDSEIRRAYRKLALEFHPDKIHKSGDESEEEIEKIKQHFLEIQEAYDIIGSSEKRMRYNLNQNDPNSDPIDEKIERYRLNPFSIFARTNQISFAFSIKFTKPEVKPIRVNLSLDVSVVFTGINDTHKYFRNVLCDTCGGNGGANGTCRQCSLCNGLGHCNHIFHDRSHSYIHTTEATCGQCLGKGCIPVGKCSKCSGTGIISQESILMYELQPGFPNGFQLIFPEFGHVTTDGRKGNVEVNFNYQFPSGWKQLHNSLDLSFSMPVQLENLANGWSTTLQCVNGKPYKLNVRGFSLVDILVNGILVVAPDYGLIDAHGSTGNLFIEVIPSWENMTFPLWIELLQASDIEPDDPYFHPLMRLYFSYADHVPDQNDLDILTTAYSTFEWNQTLLTIPLTENILQKNLNPDDIHVYNNNQENNNNNNKNNNNKGPS